MKKIAKLSLVAAVAVAGLTTANAQQLEDAIKKVEVSGSVVYRYNDYNADINDSGAVTTSGGADKHATSGTTSSSNNNYKVGVNAAAPVNDFVKLNTRFLVANNAGEFAGKDGTAGGLDTQSGGDSNVDVELSNVYFGFTGIKNTTINAGKQGLTTPWTVATQVDGNEQTGTGILALSTIENVTLAGAYFNQTNLGASGNLGDTTATGNQNIGAQDIATVGTIVAAGPVTLDAWYLDMQETFNSYTLGAKASTELAGITFGADARYTSLQLDRNYAETAYMSKAGITSFDTLDKNNLSSNIHDDNSLAKLALTAKAGILSGKAVYGKTGKDGGLTALDNDASTTLLGWSVNSNGKADADFYQLVAAVDILPELNLSANYVTVDYTSDSSVTKSTDNNVTAWSKTSVNEEEIYAQLTYKMSKNLTTYVRYGVYSQDTAAHNGNRENSEHVDANGNSIASTVDSIDDTRGRIQVAYTF